MIPEFLRNRKTYMLTALIFTIIGVLSLSFAFFRVQSINQPTNSTVMVETVDIAGSTQNFTVYYDNNDGFFETGLLNISSTYTDIMKFRVVSGYSLGNQNISINWKSVKSGLTKENTSYDLYSCTSSNYSSATLENITSLCTKVSPISGNYLPNTDEKTRLTSASDINLAANGTNYYIATINISASETSKSFDGSIAVKHNLDHILTLNLNGGTLESTTSMTLGTGDTIVLPAPSNEGLIVGTWTISCAECQVNGMNFTMGTSDATITAQWVEKTYDYEYNGTTGSDGSYQLFTAPQTGTYKVEAWGASGGYGLSWNGSTYVQQETGGYGAYTKGEIYLEKDEKLYIYVGGAGKNGAGGVGGLGGYNGGGTGGKQTTAYAAGGGGGATDVRYFSDTPSLSELEWNSELGFNSRIMVAGGGGGAFRAAGSAGGLVGYNNGGGQSYGYSFGQGGNGFDVKASAGGGGGYYGGYSINAAMIGGGGGSSFISGHYGSSSIVNSNLNIFTGSSLHYSQKYFYNTTMIDGMGYSWSNVKSIQQSMPIPTGGTAEPNVGNTGDGYAKITFVNNYVKTIEEISNEKLSLLNDRCYHFSNSYQYFTAPQTGTYKIEAWGAQGGYSQTYNGSTYLQQGTGGYGAYTKGEIYLEKDEKLYIYVGGAGGNALNGVVGTGGYNGGGTGGQRSISFTAGGGGGATDIRYFSDTPSLSELEWNSELGFNSRIMVAGGGGGAYSTVGSAGGLVGYNNGGGQSYGYSFGKGENGYTNSSIAGGGGGYYGGYVNNSDAAGGGGGSSFISGKPGSLAINNILDSLSPRTILNGCTSLSNSIMCSYHPTLTERNVVNKYFSNSTMIDGMGYPWTTEPSSTTVQMPIPTGGTAEPNVGNTGDGFAKITYLD